MPSVNSLYVRNIFQMNKLQQNTILLFRNICKINFALFISAVKRKIFNTHRKCFYLIYLFVWSSVNVVFGGVDPKSVSWFSTSSGLVILTIPVKPKKSFLIKIKWQFVY